MSAQSRYEVELTGVRSGYVGVSYRVLVELDDAAHVVYVIRIAHRAARRR